MTLSRDQILSLAPRLKPVRVEALGGEVHLKPFTVATAVKFFEAQQETKLMASLYVRMILLSACDESGSLLFGDADVDAVAALPFDAVKLLGEEIMGLNGMRPGQDEESAKNS